MHSLKSDSPFKTVIHSNNFGYSGDPSSSGAPVLPPTAGPSGPFATHNSSFNTELGPFASQTSQAPNQTSFRTLLDEAPGVPRMSSQGQPQMPTVPTSGGPFHSHGSARSGFAPPPLQTMHLGHLGHLVGHLVGHLDRWWVAWVAHKVCKDLLQLMVTLGCIALWSFQSFWMCPLRVACSWTRQKPINFVLWITKGKNWRAVKRFKALTILKCKAWLLRLFQSLKSWACCMPRLCQRQSRFRPDLWKESMYPCCIFAEAGLGVFKVVVQHSPTLATLTSFVPIGPYFLFVTVLVVDRRCWRQFSWIPGFWINGLWPCPVLPVLFLELWLESSYMEHWLDAGRIILLIFHWYLLAKYCDVWADAAHSVCACFSCLHMHRLSSLAWWAVPLAPAKSIVWISGLANHGPTRQGSWKALHGATFTKKDERIFVQFASPKDDESRHIQDIQDIICLGLWASDELKSICSVCSKCWFTTHVRKMLQFDGVCDGMTLDLFFRRSPKTTSCLWHWALRCWRGASSALLARKTNRSRDWGELEDSNAVLIDKLTLAASPAYENIPKLSTPPPVLQLLLLCPAKYNTNADPAMAGISPDRSAVQKRRDSPSITARAKMFAAIGCNYRSHRRPNLGPAWFCGSFS